MVVRLVSTPSTVELAHGVGTRSDLPIPFTFAVAGAVAALVVSFAVLTVAWPESRYRGNESGRALPVWVTTLIDSGWLRWALHLLGLGLVGFTAVAAFFAPDLASNPATRLVYVVFWVGLVPASILLGPIWRELNPVRTVHLIVAHATRVAPERLGFRRLPDGIGFWPGALGLLAFAWLELVAPYRAETATLCQFFVAYFGIQLVGVVIFGSRWLDRGDAFEAFSGLFAKLSLFGRRADGRIVIRSPLANLDTLVAAPGLAAVVCVLLGSTGYDSLSNAPRWIRWTQSGPFDQTVAGTVGLVGFVAIVYAAYLVATFFAGRGGTIERRALPGVFAHSLVPIVLGYFVAHYLTLLVIEGQRAVIDSSDPFSNGSNWFGSANWTVNTSITAHPTLIATTQVVAIVAGHVAGVISAHDRAVRVFPRRQALASQIPLMILMIVYTATGLLLLFAA